MSSAHSPREGLAALRAEMRFFRLHLPGLDEVGVGLAMFVQRLVHAEADAAHLALVRLLTYNHNSAAAIMV